MSARRWRTPERDARHGRGITLLYVIAALGGGAAIVGLRWAGFSAIVTAIVGSAVVLAYAALAMPFKPRALSTGPIGDNCYYLGFIFTLTSLAWSLYSVGEGQDDSETFVLEIVSGFGIALLTTAVGVVMRVALNSPRVDLIEEEQAAFQSIRTYYDMMHRDLASLTTTNKQFALGMRLSLDEFRKSFSEDLRSEADARREAIRDVVSNAEARLLERLAELEASATARLEAAGRKLEKTAGEGTVRAVDSVQEAAENRIGSAIDELELQMTAAAESGTSAADGLASALERLSSATESLASAAVRAGQSVDGVETALTRHLDSIVSWLDNLEAREAAMSKRLAVLSDRIAKMDEHMGRPDTAPFSSWLRWFRR